MEKMGPDFKATQEVLSLFEGSRIRLEKIIDDLPMVIAITDEQGLIWRGNRVSMELFNCDEDALMGHPIGDLFTEENRKIFFQYLQKLLKKEIEKAEFELEVETTPGIVRVFYWEIGLVKKRYPSDPQLLAILGKDITEYKRVTTEMVSLKKDLEVSGAVQNLLLPKKQSFETKEFRLTMTFQPANQVGGDWVWYSVRKDGSILILLGDVTGHGVGSAMIAAIIAGSYKSFDRLSGNRFGEVEGPKIFDVLSENLKEFGSGKYWMTVSVTEIFPKQGLMRHWSAGGPPVFIMRGDGSLEVVKIKGTPLGNGNSISIYESETVPILSKDRVLLFTDGAFEITSENQRHGLSNLKRNFQSTHGMSLEESNQHINKNLLKLRDGKPPEDDTTFVLVELI